MSNSVVENNYYDSLLLESKKCETTLFVPPYMRDNLDEYQFIDRSLVNYEKYMFHIGQAMTTNNIALQFSRGCKYNCAYCQKVYLNSYRSRSADNTFEEMEMLHVLI